MLQNNRFQLVLTALLAAGLWLVGAPSPANAGCGCDHPPPAFAPVMPPFASPGKAILVHNDGPNLREGDSYGVTFEASSGDTFAVQGIAVDRETLKVQVPSGLEPGPASLVVQGPEGFSQTHGSELFTVLPPPPVVPVGGGALERRRFDAAVASDGTLLLPFNVRHIQQAMQFAFELDGLTYAFGPDDVVFYNADGVDLTLFTLAVDGQTEMQWGSYYGWEVEDDTGLFGVVYDTKVKESSDLSKTSDVLTYWRHEFHTYTQAHLPGGSHVVDAEGLHPDGTLHINHGHLVLAISGARRQGNSLELLEPGLERVVLNVMGIPAENPIEPEVVESMLLDAKNREFGGFAPDEGHFDEFQGMDSQGNDGGSNDGGSSDGGSNGGGSSDGGSNGGEPDSDPWWDEI